MSRIQTKRRQAPLPRQKAQLEQTLRRQAAWAAGSEYFQYRDPVYHVTESFQQTFDAMGRKHTAERTGARGGFPAAGPGVQAGEQARSPRGEEGPVSSPLSFFGREEPEQLPDPASSRSFYQMKNEEDQAQLRRFSETAFQRGTLSAAVLGGTGRMMLFSCMKKTIGQSQPVKEQQRRLFDGASQVRSVPGHIPDQVVFNRTFTDSAVGLVVDTLRDARRTVEDMRDLVSGRLNRTEAGRYGADTLWNMYPFLDDSREKDLLEQYLSQLNGPEDLSAGERGLLQSAVDRTRALLDKKARMRVEFMNKLRFLSDRASEALAEFEEPGFASALDEALREILGAEPPPEDGDGTAFPEDGGDDPAEWDDLLPEEDEAPDGPFDAEEGEALGAAEPVPDSPDGAEPGPESAGAPVPEG